jgi:NAD(P)H-hydrate epimerase
MSNWVYTPEQVRQLDRIAIEEQGIAGYELMCRAAAAAWTAIVCRYPAARHFWVYCGSGNNAGDGYVLARLALAAGLQVRVLSVVDPAGLKGDAERAWRDFLAVGGQTEPATGTRTAQLPDLAVDALLGTGLDRPLSGAFAAAVAELNALAAPVVALDIPSGLHGATGAVLGCAVQAALTVTFVGWKQGLFLGAGPDHCGELVFSDLDIAPVATARVAPQLRCTGPEDIAALLGPRARGAHKGRFGHVVVLGGNRGFGGAALLSATAALRSGAGLVSVVTRPEHVSAVLAARPELMVRGVSEAAEATDVLKRATVIAVGPGLGQDDWAAGLLAAALGSGRPLVVDADALNMLAPRAQRRDEWVLTPHPGEAGRMLGASSAAVQSDRLAALRELTERFGGVVLLKGHGTLVAGSGAPLPWLVRGGNPGMATAGMGDVLTGVIAGLLAQFPDAPRATVVAIAAAVHAAAGDAAAEQGERGLVAGDVCDRLPSCVNPAP